MIEITVHGSSTFQMKDVLKANRFRWNPESKSWTRIIPESHLNVVIEAIRCPLMVGKDCTVILKSIDVTGKEMHPGFLRIRLCEHLAGNYLLLFEENIIRTGRGMTSTTPTSSLKSEVHQENKKMEGFY